MILRSATTGTTKAQLRHLATLLETGRIPIRTALNQATRIRAGERIYPTLTILDPDPPPEESITPRGALQQAILTAIHKNPHGLKYPRIRQAVRNANLPSPNSSINEALHRLLWKQLITRTQQRGQYTYHPNK